MLRGALTIKRMFLHVAISNGATGVFAEGAFGVEVGSTRSMPTVPDSPIVDLTGWYLHQNFNQMPLGGEAKDYNYDIRTARKITGEDRTLWFMLEVNGGSLAAVEFVVSVRLLLSGR